MDPRKKGHHKKEYQGNGAEEKKSLWKPEQPLDELPKPIHKLFLNYATYLFNDLRKNKLQLGLIPAQDPQHSGHKLHVVASCNPVWYSILHAAYRYRTRTNQGKWRGKGYVRDDKGKRIIIPKRRRTVLREQSKLQRQRVKLALEAIVGLEDQPFDKRKRGWAPSRYWYQTICRELIYQHLAEGYDWQGQFVPPNQKVERYFSNGNGLEKQIHRHQELEEAPF